MVSSGNWQEDGENNRKGASKSQGTTLSGQSISSSGSVGLPPNKGRARRITPETPANQDTFPRLSHLDICEDDIGSKEANSREKKRASGDKNGRGLRQFSMKVCEKVESKGRTTYNEVADELVAEYADPSDIAASSDQRQYGEKNIRRRVYDALNVLMAMGVIFKDKKEMYWKGLPHVTSKDIEELKAEQIGLRSRIEKRAAYLHELQGQFSEYQNLMKRNQQSYGSGTAACGGVALPFILVQTRPNATVEVEISEDMQLVHFDFNSTPFEVHDDNYVLMKMKQLQFQESLRNGVLQAHLTKSGECSTTPNTHDLI
ncbi:hypothetical protein Dimus_023770 [Dionaea muscipula]